MVLLACLHCGLARLQCTALASTLNYKPLNTVVACEVSAPVQGTRMQAVEEEHAFFVEEEHAFSFFSLLWNCSTCIQLANLRAYNPLPWPVNTEL